jgi:hypothetical protein
METAARSERVENSHVRRRKSPGQFADPNSISTFSTVPVNLNGT